jgi:hypothetical protein
MNSTADNCLPIKRGERMKDMRTPHNEPRGTTVNRNDWEDILGKLDALTHEINGALGRTTRIEEPKEV